MNKLILIRHGDYDNRTGLLTNNGQRKMRMTAEVLRSHLAGNTKLLSSTAPRAVESAGIICDKLNLTYEQHEVLWVDQAHPENFPGVLELVRAHIYEVDILVIITHYDYAQYFPTYFCMKVLNVDLPVRSLYKGEMRIIELAHRVVETMY